MEVADEIRKAVPEDLSRIGSALGRAFFDDPLFVWAIQDDGRRQRFLMTRPRASSPLGDI